MIINMKIYILIENYKQVPIIVKQTKYLESIKLIMNELLNFLVVLFEIDKLNGIFTVLSISYHTFFEFYTNLIKQQLKTIYLNGNIQTNLHTSTTFLLLNENKRKNFQLSKFYHHKIFFKLY